MRYIVFRPSSTVAYYRLAVAYFLIHMIAFGTSCQKEDPSSINQESPIDLGNFSMDFNGITTFGTSCFTYCFDYSECSTSRRSFFTFYNDFPELSHYRNLTFIVPSQVGYYPITILEPSVDFSISASFTEPTASLSYSVESGHATGASYLTLLDDSLQDFFAIDSIVEGQYYGRFEASFHRDTSREFLIPSLPDTISITNGKFALREYIR